MFLQCSPLCALAPLLISPAVSCADVSLSAQLFFMDLEKPRRPPAKVYVWHNLHETCSCAHALALCASYCQSDWPRFHQTEQWGACIYPNPPPCDHFSLIMRASEKEETADSGGGGERERHRVGMYSNGSPLRRSLLLSASLCGLAPLPRLVRLMECLNWDKRRAAAFAAWLEQILRRVGQGVVLKPCSVTGRGQDTLQPTAAHGTGSPAKCRGKLLHIWHLDFCCAERRHNKKCVSQQEVFALGVVWSAV